MTKLVGALLAITIWTTASSAQEAEVIASGKQEFRRNCTLCHGLNGKGDSVMVTLNLLANKPPDLTQLKKNNSGTFPFWQVYRIVDGREPIKGHGTPDMPIWGDLFSMQAEGSLTSETKATERILNLVHYLQSLQQ
ncbi:MAG: cytochrome c [Deltaproteobacteria bacterium]|nr:cytochrome c [Deltaproteobacteria bacterium]